jgi:hypothetical protein
MMDAIPRGESELQKGTNRVPEMFEGAGPNTYFSGIGSPDKAAQ